MRYAVVIERAGERNYSAYVPDLPGCVASGDTPQETHRQIAEAIKFHIESMKVDGEPVPAPATIVDWVDEV